MSGLVRILQFFSLDLDLEVAMSLKVYILSAVWMTVVASNVCGQAWVSPSDGNQDLQLEPFVVRGQDSAAQPLAATFGSAPEVAEKPSQGWLDNTFLSPTKTLVRVASPDFISSGAFLTRAFDAATLFESVPGITINAISPGSHDPSAFGRRIGQSIGDGSYWFPARQDLDTMLSKIDSRLIDSVIAVKGPYASLYGPGFSFYHVDLLDSPRYSGGFQSHGSTTLEYETNGEQWHGRQAFFGGAEEWGYRVGYSHRTGSDYTTGAGVEIPSSYNSRMLDVALGGSLTGRDNLEIHILRLDQTDVELPGQWMDINFLVTDAYEFEYVRQDADWYDTLTVEGWYNRTRLEGDNSRPGKQRFGLAAILNQTRTDVDAMSTGYRAATSWEGTLLGNLTAGVDLRYLKQRLNEFNRIPFLPQFGSARQAIPRAHSSNPGVFWETNYAAHEFIQLHAGGRVDWVSTNADDSIAAVAGDDVIATSISDLLGGDLDQHFLLSSIFLSADLQLTDMWMMNVSGGQAMRPPTMTELYAANAPFIAALPQTRGTSLIGDPNLQPERLWQLDLGLEGSCDNVHVGIHGFYSWINDYITLDMIDNGTVYAFTNTNRATLSGGDAYAEFDFTAWLKGFGNLSYVEGRDHTRNETVSRTRGQGARSGNAVSRKEPLPVMPPLQGRLGLILQDPSDDLWSVEFTVRLSDQQDRIATSLFEEETREFAVFDIRGFARLTERLTATAGVLNLTDENYQTYFDSRRSLTPGDDLFQVFQPGRSFYFGTELTY